VWLQPVTMGRDDVFTLLLHLCPTRLATAVCIGSLNLTWRRHRPSTPAPGITSPPGSYPAAATPSSLSFPAAATPSSQAPNGDPALLAPRVEASDKMVAPCVEPSDKIVARFELPTVSCQEPVMSVRTIAPPCATAGIAFPFACQVGAWGSSPVKAAHRVE
jgi:hypothetical protein